MTALPNTFLVFGETREPEVHWILDERTVRMFRDRERIAGRDKALVATFGPGAECAIPCWSKDAMTSMALGYKGPHQQRVRFICAAIALGEPYSQDEPPNPDGGVKALLNRPKPTPRGPAGAANPLPRSRTREKVR